MTAPQLLGRDCLSPYPGLPVAWFFPPVRTQVTVEELVHLVRDPRAKMDAIGDMADRNLVGRHSRPKLLPHLAADTAMQFAHAVVKGRSPKSQNGHAEFFPLVGRILPPQAQELGSVD